VTNKDAIYALTDRIVKENGKIDNLITCAGISYNKPYMESSDDEFRKTLEVNLLGVNNCCQAALIQMIPRREGKIVNIESASSRQGSNFYTHYSASKFGVLGLTQGIGLEAAKYNINVNGICPGVIETTLGRKQGGGLTEQAAKYSGKPEEQIRESIRKAIPLRRFQTGEDVGHMALFLCSDLAKNITCQSINVCGGMRMN
jgi:meso-butanediol dehydrogenase/(S,S)-butanediol dehydrogenase/diacetyl reductase